MLTLVAPDFVVLEILFDFGYKQDIFNKANKNIEKNISEYRKKIANKKKNWNW